jgi:hypothetical protein
MNTRHYLSTIFIFTVVLLSVFLVNAQTTSDSIKIVKHNWGYDFYQNCKTININQLTKSVKDNPAALNYIRRAMDFESASVAFGVIGGGGLGFAAGYAIGCAITKKSIKMNIFLPTLLGGSALIVCSVTFSAVSKENFRKGVTVYNNSLKQKDNTHINLGFLPTGMIFKLNF